MSLHCIVWCCMVLYCWLLRAGCISQDTYLLYVYLCSFFWSHVFPSFGHMCFFLSVTCVSSFSHVLQDKREKISCSVREYKNFQTVFHRFTKPSPHLTNFQEAKKWFWPAKGPIWRFCKRPNLKVVKGLGQCRPGTVYDIWWPECSVHQQLYFTFFF